jgi:1-aminocyclopropane-1-carboxylate deaminase/D-cysteine desulfhydrase-like pyridoxal-dependent ACC family enzyme
LSPIKKYNIFNSTDLFVKHDDYLEGTGSGNKVRKNRYIIADAIKQNCNAIVSAGAANSNHARVIAMMGAQLGWPVKLAIHDEEDYSNGNLLLMKLAGADLTFLKLSEVSEAMDVMMAEFIQDGRKPYYVWGGGHSVHGSHSYFEAVKELQTQLNSWVPDYIFVASGTGGTQAGIHVGCEYYFPETKVIGVSVARNKNRGQEIVEKSSAELRSFLKISAHNNPVIFKDEWTCGGYGSISQAQLNSINRAAKCGLTTDPTYTGKALHGLISMVENGEIRQESNILFWHTGGLINLLNNYHLFI